jgi:hypothetical protein
MDTLAEIHALFGPDHRLTASAGLVTGAFLRERVLAPATLALDGDDTLVDVDEPALRAGLEREHAPLLAEHGLRHLDLAEIRSRTRVVTQRIARTLYERGAAAIKFGSNLDDRPCYAIFEARGHLVAAGDPIALATDLPDLVTVCEEYGLRIA